MTEQDAAAGAAPGQAEEPLGTVLRMAREAAGLGREEVARQLKFAPRQLDALERGEWSRLPGGAAVRGMVRQYSRLLGLDADAMVARASQAAPTPDQLAERFQQPVPFSNQSRRSNLAYVALSIVLLGVVAAVALQWRHEIGSRAQPSFVSAAQQPAEPAKATPVEIPAAQPVAEVNAPSAEAAPAEPAPTGPLARLVLRFAEESWVEIHSGSGKLLVSHLHPAGGERVVTGVPPFSVVIGNAEHVKLTYNDRPVDLAPYIKVEVARFTLE